MQRALHGLDVSPLAARDRAHADARSSSPRSSTIPTAAGSTRGALVRVDRFDGARRRAAGACWSTASGDVAGHLRPARRGRAGGAARLVHAARRLRRPLAVEARGRGVARHRAASASRPPGRRSTALANALRGAGARRVPTHLAPVDRALLAGFLLGDTRGVPEALTEQFRAAGLTHLTAVSGENVAFVLALFAPLLRRLGLRGRRASRRSRCWCCSAR